MKEHAVRGRIPHVEKLIPVTPSISLNKIKHESDKQTQCILMPFHVSHGDEKKKTDQHGRKTQHDIQYAGNFHDYRRKCETHSRQKIKTQLFTGIRPYTGFTENRKSCNNQKQICKMCSILFQRVVKDRDCE